MYINAWGLSEQLVVGALQGMEEVCLAILWVFGLDSPLILIHGYLFQLTQNLYPSVMIAMIIIILLSSNKYYILCEWIQMQNHTQ